MRLILTWPNLYPLWIETRGGKFFTTSYNDEGSLSWAYAVVQYTRGLLRQGDGLVIRAYPFWDSAPRCRDRILGIWDSYPEAKEHLLTTQDELCYLAGCWVLDSGRVSVLPHTEYARPEIRGERPDTI
jgi:hypothetical protein